MSNPDPNACTRNLKNVQLKATVYRGSSVLNGIFNQRYGVLTNDTLLTFKAPTDSEPTRLLPLHPHCTCTSVTEVDALIREKHASSLRAYITKSYDKRTLWVFTVHWPKNLSLPGDLTLGFESESLARDWRTRLLACFEAVTEVRYDVSSRETSALQSVMSPSMTPSRRGIFGMLRPPKVGSGTPSHKRMSVGDADDASVGACTSHPGVSATLPPPGAGGAKTPAPASVKRGLFGGHRRARSEIPQGMADEGGVSKVTFDLPVINSPDRDATTTAKTPSPLPISAVAGRSAQAPGEEVPSPARVVPIDRRNSGPKASGTYSTPSTPSLHQHSRIHRSMHSRNDSSSSVDSLFMADALLPGDADADRLGSTASERRWVSAKRVHGVSIYHESEATGGVGTYMVSVVVRSHPEAVFRAVMDSRTYCNTPHLPLVNLRVVQTFDPQSQLLTGEILPEAWMPNVFAGRRHVTVERTWRHEEVDGSYVVLYTSVTPQDIEAFNVNNARAASRYVDKASSNADLLPSSTPPNGMAEIAPADPAPAAAPAPAPEPIVVCPVRCRQSNAVWPLNRLFQWVQQPVEATIESAGYTIAPLQPKYTMGGVAPPESLVTMVLRVDLGGWLHEPESHGRSRNPLSWMAKEFRRVAAQAWVEPMLLSVLALRDRVEQERFVVRPFRQDLEAMGMVAVAPALPKESEGAKEKAEKDKDKEGVPRTATEVLIGMNKHRRMHSLAASPAMSRDEAPSTPGGSFLLTEGATEEAAVRDGKARPPPIRLGSKDMRTAEERQAQLQARLEAEAAMKSYVAPCSLPRQYWTEIGAASYVIRGKHYLKDHKKYPATAPVMQLAGIELFKLKRHTRHIARYIPWLKDSPMPFHLLMNLMVPANPPCSLVASWSFTDVSELERGTAPWARLLRKFIAEETPDTWRNGRFKLIPNIAQGSWVIKQAVGSTPVILGKKLKQVYYRGPNYFEIDVDITTSSAAATATRMVHGATKSLLIDMAILLEGHEEEELPEFLLGSLRLVQLDLTASAELDTGAAAPEEADSLVKNFPLKKY